MSKQTSPEDRQPAPDDASTTEPTQGGRENTSVEEGAGITNRPIEEEQREQQSLPPRGRNKEGGHA
jgi:hypothetical protein